jgi:cell division protein FtsQ
MFATFNQKTKWFLRLGAGMVVLGLMAFAEVRQRNLAVTGIVIRIQPLDGHSFLTIRDVRGYLTNEGSDPLEGQSYQLLNFQKLEARLLRHGLVKACQVSRDLAGNLLVNVEQPRPLARLIEMGDSLHPATGQYISEAGHYFPISMNYTARVPTISGAFFTKKRLPMAQKSGPQVLDLLRFIAADPFWQAQVAGIEVAANADVTLSPQVGRHRIEIGPATELEAKFRKLKLFYTDIIPLKGWDFYQRVSVQYQNQLVCERHQDGR